MEWCRMYRLKIVFCVVLVWCELTVGQPDRNLYLLSEREKKLQELLKSLETQSSDKHQVMPEQNFSQPTFSLTVSPFLKQPDSNGRMLSEEHNSYETEVGAIDNYQDYYRKMYGTREGVELLRKKYGPNGLGLARAKFPRVNKGIHDVRRANNHYLRMDKHAQCKIPAPRVIKVKKYYPDPSKVYKPRCTILHRCGDDTGCCKSDAEHCVPKSIQEVTLHFYTFSIGKNGPESKVEKLLFQNHTACQCQLINDLPRLVKPEENPLDGKENSSNIKCGDCPMPFTTRIYEDGRCGCDCFDGQKSCLRTKRGKESLSKIEKQCVEANHCLIPECAYGIFNPDTGSCPRKTNEITKNYHRRLQTANHKCRDCPIPFSSHIYENGRCSCDCFDRQKSCLNIKEGRDKLSEIERRCVEANHCHIPDCAFGIFDPVTGFCPSKAEEFTGNHQPVSHSSKHRWSFIERD